jgi:hypothetical protein
MVDMRELQAFDVSWCGPKRAAENPFSSVARSAAVENACGFSPACTLMWSRRALFSAPY